MPRIPQLGLRHSADRCQRSRAQSLTPTSLTHLSETEVEQTLAAGQSAAQRTVGCGWSCSPVGDAHGAQQRGDVAVADEAGGGYGDVDDLRKGLAAEERACSHESLSGRAEREA